MVELLSLEFQKFSRSQTDSGLTMQRTLGQILVV
jgi:hypothetical protein